MGSEPRVGRIVVERAKITNYLLDASHPRGASKCALLARFGFRRDEPERLASALIEHFEAHPVAAVVETEWGDGSTSKELCGRPRGVPSTCGPSGRSARSTTSTPGS